MIFEEGDYYYSPSKLFNCINTQNPNYSKKSKMMINKKRFSDEQVKSLETIFENETKLEPKKKVQLANDLGLQPRQIAIWFQNKRARYKSKQLEGDYNVLRANYNSLLSKFDHLKKEKQSLLIELEKLKEQCGHESGVTYSEESLSEEIDKVESNNNENKKKIYNNQGEEKQKILSKEGSSENTKYFGIMDEETNIMSTIMQPIVIDNASSHEWGDLHHDYCLFDQHVDACQWLDFLC
ncbi:hypothetical protein RND81_06G038600 [Saponaria officinalis]|uniref:Homeobox-leucine zipper protein n=1 Tax=Saponaria officinalis TaxID=3572 RepID=A0AAW1K7F8_SAPOF